MQIFSQFVYAKNNKSISISQINIKHLLKITCADVDFFNSIVTFEFKKYCQHTLLMRGWNLFARTTHEIIKLWLSKSKNFTLNFLIYKFKQK